MDYSFSELTKEQSDLEFSDYPCIPDRYRFYWFAKFRLVTGQVSFIQRLEELGVKALISMRNLWQQEEQMSRLFRLCFLTVVEWILIFAFC